MTVKEMNTESAGKKSSAALGLLPSADNRPVPSPQPEQFIVCKVYTRAQKHLLQKCFQNPRAADQSCSSTLPFKEPLIPQRGFTEDYMKSPTEGWGRQLVTLKPVIRSLKNPTPAAPFHLYAVLQHPVHRAA